MLNILLYCFKLYIQIIRTAERIIGVHLPNLQDLCNSRVKKRTGNIITEQILFWVRDSKPKLDQSAVSKVASEAIKPLPHISHFKL